MQRSLIILTILFVVFSTVACISTARVEGTAMQPTFNDGDRILVNTDVGEIRRGDVILFKFPKDPKRFYIKRVIGLPNEKIEVNDGVVSINGHMIEENYIDQVFNQSKYSMPSTEIPPTGFFVLGDNRDNSSDSRYWGPVDRELITGKYYLTYTSAENKK